MRLAQRCNSSRQPAGDDCGSGALLTPSTQRGATMVQAENEQLKARNAPNAMWGDGAGQRICIANHGLGQVIDVCC